MVFQSSFELTGYITILNNIGSISWFFGFQSSFELTGYITELTKDDIVVCLEMFQSSFELTGYITTELVGINIPANRFKALSSLRVI